MMKGVSIYSSYYSSTIGKNQEKIVPKYHALFCIIFVHIWHTTPVTNNQQEDLNMSNNNQNYDNNKFNNSGNNQDCRNSQNNNNQNNNNQNKNQNNNQNNNQNSNQKNNF